MKNICIIAGSFIDYQILKPLMREIRQDPSACLHVIFTEKHQTSEFSIMHSRLEQDGFTMEEKTDIEFNSHGHYTHPKMVDFEQKEYDRLLKMVQPDIVVLSGNAYPTYLAAVCASLNQIPIAHVEGGKSDFDIWDKSYGYGITKLSQLHFTSSEKYRQQIIKFGEHPESVFNVGSLLMENIKKISLPSKTSFSESIRLEENTPFIFISFEPDLAAGSANETIFKNILNTVCAEEFSDFKLIFSPQKACGLGKMISRMIDAFSNEYPDRAIILPSKDLTDFGCAIKYCSAMISNFFEGLVIASSFKKPVINIGRDLKDTMPNPIDCGPDHEDLFCSLQKALTDQFNMEIKQTPAPFEKVLTARTINGMIKTFDMRNILHKEYFES